MKTTNVNRLLSFIVCLVLIAAVALFTSGCTHSETQKNEPTSQTSQTTQTAQVKVLGEGKTMFYFTVVDGDKNETKFEIHTDKTTVGDALLELGLVEGEDSDFGLYVKKVNGIPESDGAYWMIYENDTMAPTGVSQLEIKNGESYSLKLEKM